MRQSRRLRFDSAKSSLIQKTQIKFSSRAAKCEKVTAVVAAVVRATSCPRSPYYERMVEIRWFAAVVETERRGPI